MKITGGQTTRLEPRGHDRHHDDGVESHEFAFYVPADLRWFQGHFDGNPVLPAVVQLQEVLRCVRTAWPDQGRLQRVWRAKFRRPIRPCESIRIRVRAIGARRVRFQFLNADETCSSGIFEFAAPGDSLR